MLYCCKLSSSTLWFRQPKINGAKNECELCFKKGINLTRPCGQTPLTRIFKAASHLRNHVIKCGVTWQAAWSRDGLSSEQRTLRRKAGTRFCFHIKASWLNITHRRLADVLNPVGRASGRRFCTPPVELHRPQHATLGCQHFGGIVTDIDGSWVSVAQVFCGGATARPCLLPIERLDFQIATPYLGTGWKLLNGYMRFLTPGYCLFLPPMFCIHPRKQVHCLQRKLATKRCKIKSLFRIIVGSKINFYPLKSTG